MYKKLFGICVIILFMVVTVYYYFSLVSEQPITTVPITTVPITKLEIISDNPDLIFKNEWPDEYIFYKDDLKFVSMSIPGIFSPWYSNGAYLPEEFPKGSGKKGIVIIHPYSSTIPAFLAQNVTLGYENYILVAEIANLADYIRPCLQTCSDVVIKIKIIDILSSQEEEIYNDVVDSREGWQNVTLDISNYKGKSIVFKIEGHAGGHCHSWCGEWAAVNKFYIGKVIA